jgi:Heterokaryon incompatibility protein (HET)
MEFRYRPLNTNEIRLLKPLSQSSNSLSFEIVHISLLSKPRYTALSYTWGPPGDVYKILLNGLHFPIRQNLFDALQQIQRSQLVDQYLWVDAICINQGEDNDALNERSLHISLMKQIYEQAAKVLVWLGRPENEANNRLAFPMMKDFEKRLRRVQKKGRPYRPWWWPRKPRTVGQDAADFLLTVSPAKDKRVFDVPGSQTYRAWLGIVSLWKSPWWTRTWIFQESTIPESHTTVYISGVSVLPYSSKVRFLCGDQETSWPELEATSIVASNILTTPGIDARFLVGAQKPFDKLLKFRRKRIEHVLRSFLDILQMFRHTACFDPRDKVYAPLGLAPDDIRHYIRADYGNKTVLNVYTDVVRYYLAQPGRNLDFLGYTVYQEEAQVVETPQGVKSVLPSWVPNFSAGLDIVPIPKILHVPENLDQRQLTFYDKRGIPSNKEALIAAYRPLGVAPSRSFIQGNTLYLSGVYIDVLKDIILNTGPDLEAVRAVAREKGHKWAIDSKHKYFTGESFGDAINRTTVLDVVYDELSRPSERGGKLDSAFLKRPRAELSLTEYRYQMNMRVAQINASISRNLGLSQKLYLLMIPNTAVVGDGIWALAGGQALYILRPMNREANQYRFIGECYTHGLMDGEIVRRLHVEARMEDLSLI